MSNEQIPTDFELILKSLSNIHRFEILSLLLKNEKLTLNDFKKLLDKNIQDLPAEIKTLELAGLVQNFLQKSENSNEYSFYSITALGKEIFTGILNAYNHYYKNIEVKQIKSFSNGSFSADLKTFEDGTSFLYITNLETVSTIILDLEHEKNLKKILKEAIAFKRQKYAERVYKDICGIKDGN